MNNENLGRGKRVKKPTAKAAALALEKLGKMKRTASPTVRARIEQAEEVITRAAEEGVEVAEDELDDAMKGLISGLGSIGLGARTVVNKGTDEVEDLVAAFGRSLQMRGGNSCGAQAKLMGGGTCGAQAKLMGGGSCGAQAKLMGGGTCGAQAKLMGGGTCGAQAKLMGGARRSRSRSRKAKALRLKGKTRRMR
jgi:hypothetical protein